MKYNGVLKDEEDKYLQTSIAVLEACDTELGTFATSDSKLPSIMDGFSDWILKPDNNSLVLKRSKTAYGNITNTNKGYQKTVDGKVTDEFQIKVQDAKRELKAAYDYKNKTTAYGDNIWDDFETKSNYTAEKIKLYLSDYGKRYNVGDKDDELVKIWEETMGMTVDQAIEGWDGAADAADPAADTAAEDEHIEDEDKDTVFKLPQRAENTDEISDFVGDAEKFLENENEPKIVDETKLQNFSQGIYSKLLGVGIVIAVIVGLILGVKLMIAPVGERADAKKLLIPYVVGCVVVFGAFGIWKLVVTILSGV